MSRKILLVEDEVLIAMSEAQMLKKHGYEVLTVNTGEKAVDAVDSDSTISLILMDINLGRGIDGTEAAERILAAHDLPVVFLSSHTEAEVVEKTERITSYGYIIKNSGETVLLASIRMAFRLWESEDKFRKAFDYTSVGMVLTSPSGELLRVNEAFTSMFGYSPAEILSVNFSRLTHPEDIEKSITHLQAMIEGKTDCSRFTKRYIKKDGAVVWADVNTMLLRDSDRKPLHFITHVQDITESRLIQEELDQQREQYEKKLRDNEAMYRNLIENSIDAVYLLSQAGEILQVNHAACQMIGYSRAELLQLTIDDVDLNYPSRRFIEFWNNKPEGTTVLFETIHRHKNGKEIPVEVNGIFFMLTGQKYLFGVSRDITERARKEDILKEKNNLLERIFDNNTDLIALTDLEGNYKMAGNAHKILGYEIEHLIGKNVMDFVHPEDIPFVGREFNEFVQSGRIRNAVYRYRRIDGEYLWFETTGIILKDIHNSPEQILFNTRDITERKLAEERLAKQNTELKLKDNAIQNALSGIAFNDMQGEIFFVNDALVKMFGCENPDEVYGKTIFDGHPDFELERLNVLLETLRTEGSCKAELKAKKKNGDLFDVQIAATIVPDESGNPICIMASFEDISERKQAEDKLREALTEKEFLMKELNHRVKNNLFMISSLISLKDTETETKLSDIQHQIEAIGLIHERLYQTGNVTEICCRDYFNDLLTSIFSSFTAGDVKLKNDVEDICVPTKTAISLGLIINEIATNAIKHGFSQEEETIFSSKMEEDRVNSRYILTLSNTGNPFPEEIGVDNSDTLGLRLISALVAQIGGTLELKKRPYPVFTIRFPTGEE